MNRWTPGDIEIANWQFWLLLFLIPSTIAAVARYLSFRVRYEGTELVIRSGLLFRNERHVPYARIQNLDAVRNVAHRLLGVAEVRVETGGGQAPEATIRVLHETVFEEMRRRIFEGRARGAGGCAAAGDAGGRGSGRRIEDPPAPAPARAVAQRPAGQPRHAARGRGLRRAVGGGALSRSLESSWRAAPMGRGWCATRRRRLRRAACRRWPGSRYCWPASSACWCSCARCR